MLSVVNDNIVHPLAGLTISMSAFVRVTREFGDTFAH